MCLCVCVGVGVSDLIISLHVTLFQTLNLITIVYHTFVVQTLNAQPVTQNRLGKYAERRAGLGNKQTGDICRVSQWVDMLPSHLQCQSESRVL